TSDLVTSTPAAVTASAMSRVPIEPNRRPSSPAFAAIVTDSSASLAARASASAFLAAAAASRLARRSSNSAMFFAVAATALPCGKRKLRPKPAFTVTLSPILPNLPTLSSRITSISLTLYVFVYPSCTACGACTMELLVAVSVGNQSQITSALDRGRQLTLVAGFGAGNTAWNNFAGFTDVCLQRFDIFVIDALGAFSGKTTEFATTEKTCHWLYPLLFFKFIGICIDIVFIIRRLISIIATVRARRTSLALTAFFFSFEDERFFSDSFIFTQHQATQNSIVITEVGGQLVQHFIATLNIHHDVVSFVDFVD